MKRFLEWTLIVSGVVVGGAFIVQAVQSGRRRAKDVLRQAEAVAEQTRATVEQTESAIRTVRHAI